MYAAVSSSKSTRYRCFRKVNHPFQPRACAGDIVQDPFDLRPGKIGRQRQTGLCSEAILSTIAASSLQMLSVRVSCQTMALITGFAGLLFPDHGGLTLIGYTDGGNICDPRPDLSSAPG